jgi:hypothetical protein
MRHIVGYSIHMILPIYGIALGLAYVLTNQLSNNSALWLPSFLPLFAGMFTLWAQQKQKLTPLLREMLWVYFVIWTLLLICDFLGYAWRVPISAWVGLSSVLLIVIVVMTFSARTQEMSMGAHRGLLYGAIAGVLVGQLGLPLIFSLFGDPLGLIFIFLASYFASSVAGFVILWICKMKQVAWGFLIGMILNFLILL